MSRLRHALVAITLAAPLGVALVPLVVSPTASAAAPTCQGQEATIVGKPGQRVRGTAGPDVIVARDPFQVDAGAGADVICVRGDSALIDAGDDLDAGDQGSHDVIVVSGRETVVISGIQSSTADNTDVVRSTRGPLEVEYLGFPAGTIDAEDASVVFSSGLDAPWVVDATVGRITVGGRPALSYQGVDDYDLSDAGWSSLRFLGTARDESVRLENDFRRRADRPIDVRLGEGADYVGVTYGQSGTFAGGPGSDSILLTRRAFASRVGSVTADLVAGRIAASGQVTLLTPGFENASIEKYRTVRLIGTPRANLLAATACAATMSGDDGADSFRLQRRGVCEDGPGLTARGGRGNDTLQGSSGRDVLLGGRGRDDASGGRGVDRCRAESTRTCERG